MRLFFIALTLFTMVSTQVIAAGQVNVKINGVVCDFCAQALKKTFMKREEVKEFDLSLADKVMVLGFHHEQDLDDDTIKTLVENAGYNVAEIMRD